MPSEFTSKGNATLTRLDDNSLLASGMNPSKEVYEVTSHIRGDDWRGFGWKD